MTLLGWVLVGAVHIPSWSIGGDRWARQASALRSRRGEGSGGEGGLGKAGGDTAKHRQVAQGNNLLSLVVLKAEE